MQIKIRKTQISPFRLFTEIIVSFGIICKHIIAVRIHIAHIVTARETRAQRVREILENTTQLPPRTEKGEPVRASRLHANSEC